MNLYSARREERTVDWSFERDGDGLWRWTHLARSGVSRSRRRFGDLWACVEDAKKNGFEERCGTSKDAAPALLH